MAASRRDVQQQSESPNLPLLLARSGATHPEPLDDYEREADARNFGEEAKAVRGMPCLVAVKLGHSFWSETGACGGACRAAHVTARGMGAVKGGRFDLVPLCDCHHEEAGEAETSQRAAFEKRYGLDLRAEADRIALEHPEPLGIRGLARRWAFCNPPRLDDYEREALLGWVRRRMGRCKADVHADGDREELAHDVMTALGWEALGSDPAGEHGLAWDLCDLAGWPS